MSEIFARLETTANTWVMELIIRFINATVHWYLFNISDLMLVVLYMYMTSTSVNSKAVLLLFSSIIVGGVGVIKTEVYRNVPSWVGWSCHMDITGYRNGHTFLQTK